MVDIIYYERFINEFNHVFKRDTKCIRFTCSCQDSCWVKSCKYWHHLLGVQASPGEKPLVLCKSIYQPRRTKLVRFLTSKNSKLRKYLTLKVSWHYIIWHLLFSTLSCATPQVLSLETRTPLAKRSGEKYHTHISIKKAPQGTNTLVIDSKHYAI